MGPMEVSASLFLGNLPPLLLSAPAQLRHSSFTHLSPLFTHP